MGFMNLTEYEVTRLRRILWEIRKETHGRSRGIFIDNKLDQISQLLKKAERRNKRENERVNKSEEQAHS